MIFERKGQILDLGAGGAWDDTGLIAPAIIYKDNLFYMFYYGCSGTLHKIGLATSPDGETFTKQGQVLDPEVSLNIAYGAYFSPSVMYKDNQFYLYYVSYESSIFSIKLATSPDGETFTKQGQVLALGAGGTWDDNRIGSVGVIYKDNLFYMIYTGHDGSTPRIGLATSPDGVTFTKQGQVLNVGAGGTWDASGVYGMSILYKDNLFYMFYGGYNGSNHRLGIATSPDGETFTKQGQVLDLGGYGMWDDAGLFTGSVIYKDNLFYLFHSGYDGSNHRLGLSVSNCEPLRIHEWRAQYASGTLNFLPGLNDGGDD